MALSTVPPSIAWPFAIMFIYTSTIMCSANAVPLYVIHRLCAVMSGGVHCDSHEVSTAASNWILALSLTQAIPAVLVAGTLGVLSDSLGRRMTVIPPTVATTLSVAMIWGIIWWDLSLNWLLLANLVSGFGGGSATLFLGGFSSVSDTTVATERSSAFAILEAALYGGVVLGTFLLGPGIDKAGYAWLYCGLLATSAIAAFLAIIAPETLPVNAPARTAPIQWRRANLVSALGILTEPCLWGSNWVLVGLAGAFTMFYGALQGWYAILILFGTLRFNWGASDVAYFSSADWAMRLAAVLIGTPLLFASGFTRRVGKFKLMMIVVFICTCFQSCEYGVFLFAPSTPWMYLGAVLDGGAAIAIPIMRSQFSLAAPKEKQGASLAVISACETVCNLVAPAVFAFIWGRTNAVFWRASLVALMGMMVLGGASVYVTVCAVRSHVRRNGITDLDALLHLQDAKTPAAAAGSGNSGPWESTPLLA